MIPFVAMKKMHNLCVRLCTCTESRLKVHIYIVYKIPTEELKVTVVWVVVCWPLLVIIHVHFHEHSGTHVAWVRLFWLLENYTLWFLLFKLHSMHNSLLVHNLTDYFYTTHIEVVLNVILVRMFCKHMHNHTVYYYQFCLLTVFPTVDPDIDLYHAVPVGGSVTLECGVKQGKLLECRVLWLLQRSLIINNFLLIWIIQMCVVWLCFWP